ncbi:MAG: O-antigen ligase family protein, partial [bacterium]|nr:O-antigen ligase family protein [bacterium]
MAKSKKKRGVPKPTAASSEAPSKMTPPPAAPEGKRPQVAEVVVALGLAGIVFMRPWYDGLTFPEKNFSFLWVICAVALIWGVWALTTKQTVRFGLPILLWSILLGVAFLSSFGSVRADRTYIALLIWSGHFLIFVVAANALRTRWSLGIVLGAFVIASAAEGVWSILHLDYALPNTRQDVMENPMLLMRFFGTTELTPALAHRLNVNRAFGSFLFPNALAAWVVIGIPVAAGIAADAILRLVADVRNRASASAAPDAGNAALAGFSASVVSFCMISFYYTGYFVLVYRDDTWTNHLMRWGTYCIGFPLVIGGLAYFLTHRYGLRAFWRMVVAFFGLFMLVVECYVLWLTASRGGLLATIAAVACGAALLRYAPRFQSAGLRPAGKAAAVLLLIGCVAGLGWGAGRVGPATAQEAPVSAAAPEPAGEVVLEGVPVTVGDRLNTATMGLRLTYWRTGLRMALDNLATGVGLGNFATIYPKYQYLGAGDVKQAHNDFIQMLCDTGLFGMLAFAAFWAFFFLRGAVSVLVEREHGPRWLNAGLFIGVLAFVLHSVVDFNFFNPSLAMTAFLMAGTFLAASVLESPAPVRKRPAWAIVVPVLGLAAVCVVAAYPVRMLGTALGSEVDRGARYRTAQHMLQTVSNNPGRRPSIFRVMDVEPLIADREAMAEIGSLQQLLPNNSARPLGPKEPTNFNTLLVVHDPRAARGKLLELAEDQLIRATMADRLFPRTPEVATHIFQWYDLLYAYASTDEEKHNLLKDGLTWTEEAVRRSPYQAPYRDLHAKILWRMGTS